MKSTKVQIKKIESFETQKHFRKLVNLLFIFQK
jgi:hypothetical protein